MAQRTAIGLTGDDLTVDDVWAVAVDRAGAGLTDRARERMNAARELVERAAHGSREHTYGVNTGFGRFVAVAIPEEQTTELQLRLLRSHACGVGEPYPDEIVRAAMLLRANALAKGLIDICQNDTAAHLMVLDAGGPIAILGGIHTGCWELFGSNAIRSVRELKGKTVAAPERSSRQAFVAGLAKFVGLNPSKDIRWINHEPGESMRLFAEGKIDAFMGFAPRP